MGRRPRLRRDASFLEDQQSANLAVALRKVMVTRGFCFGSPDGSRQDACPPLNRLDADKHGLFRNLERRGVAFIAGLAAAADEDHSSRRGWPTAASPA